jgi:phosphoglycolate phosphatase/putative hydrolase of the HAD superfamily
MLRDLIVYCLRRPDQWKDLLILHHFRLLREEITNDYGNNENILNIYYRLTAEKTRVPLKRVEDCIEKWIMIRPLKYIKHLRYPGVLDFYKNLKEASIKMAAFSDYPVVEKLRALGMSEMIAVCTTDQEVNSMKPDTKGLLLVVKKLNVPIDACLFIGDREERDGECARRISMPYLIKNNMSDGIRHFKSYKILNEEFRQIT